MRPQILTQKTVPQGQSLGEYGLVLIILAMAAIAGLSQIGVNVLAMFTNFASKGFPTPPP
jgi:hypothetical protein